MCLALVLTDAHDRIQFFFKYNSISTFLEGFRYNLCIGRLVGHRMRHVFQQEVSKQLSPIGQKSWRDDVPKIC